ncbi:type IV fimbrial biogenesis protein FimT [Litorivivens lipolytica]|uniref:Type II secretion system protein H n=1 Tax=Litorivivens lipolytica TaxID=1524264 RepID=A0A7W4W734_9GAMM|nr:GspH/FimT family pseudopilin [Litorivivens lipolytica]MBB3048713.1 type IV fimbrial biogenesis protein FimT [Litorivivens lipolytica]
MRAKGFTLVELMVTLTIAAILLGVAAPAFSAWTANQRLRSAGYDLLNDLQLARSEAVKRGGRVTVNNGDGKWHTGWEVFVDSNEDGDRDTGEEALFSRSAYGDLLTIAGNSSVSQYVSYIPSGDSRRANGALMMGTITLCSDQSDKALALVVSRGGRARLDKTTRTAAGC